MPRPYDYFNPVVMTSLLHYTMGGLEIDAEPRVLSTEKFITGEVAGGLRDANHLGGSTLLRCVLDREAGTRWRICCR